VQVPRVCAKHPLAIMLTPSNKPATECTMALSLKAKLKPAIVTVTIRNVPCNAPKTNSQLTITSHEHSAKCGTK